VFLSIEIQATMLFEEDTELSLLIMTGPNFRKMGIRSNDRK